MPVQQNGPPGQCTTELRLAISLRSFALLPARHLLPRPRCSCAGRPYLCARLTGALYRVLPRTTFTIQRVCPTNPNLPVKTC